MRWWIAGVLLLYGAATAAAQGMPAPRDRAAALRPHAAEWQALIAAEDARAPDEASLRVLMEGTRASSPELRAVAVRALGRLEQPALIDSIAHSLGDPAPSVRAAAADALAQTAPADAGVRALLLAALPAPGGDPVAVAGIAESLGRLQHADSAAASEVLDRLMLHLGESAEAELGVLRGVYFMARQPRVRVVFDDAARAALASRLLGADAADVERVRVVAAAALVAAGTPDPAVLDSILRTDPSAYVRREAAAGAAALADTAAAARLLRTGLRDPSPVVQYDALRGWGRIAGSHGCEPFAAAAASSYTSLRLLAYDGLAATCRNDPAAGPVLRLAVDEGAGAREAARALASLAAVDPAAARERFARFANSENMFVRMAAARAAAVLGDEMMLRRFAGDAHANVRTIAVQSLARMGAEATDVYLAQLAHDESELLMAAAAALAGNERREVVPTLLDALDRVTALRRETSRDGRVALLTAIGQLGSVTDAAHLRPYLSDFDVAIAQHAAETLSAWTGTDVIATPRPLPRDPLPTFEEAAALEDAQVTIEFEGGELVTLRLLPFDAPANAHRFARLADAGYYDGLTLHRVVPNFVAQGGSPGANEYSGAPAFSRDELGLSNGNWRGTVGLSTRGRDTGDAQFYINLIDNIRLDHEYTVFAEVVSGMDVIDALIEGAVIRRVMVSNP